MNFIDLSRTSWANTLSLPLGVRIGWSGLCEERSQSQGQRYADPVTQCHKSGVCRSGRPNKLTIQCHPRDFKDRQRNLCVPVSVTVRVLLDYDVELLCDGLRYNLRFSAYGITRNIGFARSITIVRLGWCGDPG